METQRLSKKIQEFYLKLLVEKGEFGIYKYAVGSAIIKSTSFKNCDTELLDLSEKFFSLSRSEGEQKFFIIGCALRKSAHKIYRTLKLVNNEKQINLRFLHIVG